MQAGGVDRLEDVARVGELNPSDLRDRGSAVQMLCEDVGSRLHPAVQLLDPAWHVHRPGAIAEIALELAQDRGRRVAQERCTVLRIEVVDCFDQSHTGDLAQVLADSAAACITHGQVAVVRHVLDDHRLAQCRVLPAARLNLAHSHQRQQCVRPLRGPVTAAPVVVVPSTVHGRRGTPRTDRTSEACGGSQWVPEERGVVIEVPPYEGGSSPKAG